MKAIVGLMMLTCAMYANAQGDGTSIDTSQAKSLPETAQKRMVLLTVMETACTLQQNQGEQGMNAADECKIISMAHSSKCLEQDVCEPIDSEIKQYIQSVKASPSGQ